MAYQQADWMWRQAVLRAPDTQRLLMPWAPPRNRRADALLEETLRRVLRDTGQAVGATAYGFMKGCGGARYQPVFYEKIATDGTPRRTDGCAGEIELPWLCEQLAAEEWVQIAGTDGMPPAATEERRLMQAEGLRHVVAVPVGRVAPHPAFLFWAGSAPLPDGMARLLKAAGNWLAGALARRDDQSAAIPQWALEEVFKVVPDAVVLVGERGQIVHANEQAEELFGYAVEELRSEPLSMLLPERFRAAHAQHFRHFFTDPRQRPMGSGLDLYAQRKDGTEFPVDIALSPIQTPDELLVASAIRDVSDRQRARERLEESNRRWRLLVEQNPSAVFITVGGVVQYANPAAAALFGVEAAHALEGTSVFDFLPVAIKPRIRARIDKLERGASTDPLVHKLLGGDGTTRIIEVNSVPIMYQGRQAVQTVGHDVTERHRYEAGLRKAKEEAIRAQERAEEMSRLKSALMANMSHEVRTPLTSIIGFAEAIREEMAPGGEITPEAAGTAHHFAELIRQSGDRLLATLNAVLDLSSLESGTMPVQPRPVDVAAAVRSVLDGVRQQAKDEGVALVQQLPDVFIVDLDEAVLHHVLRHLVSNALKFTDAGGTVTLTVEGDAESVRIHIADTGIGISKAFRPHLFEAFQQESSGLHREYEGVGLGLAVTHRLVTLMQGTIEVDSTRGEGTCVTVHFPR